MVSKQFIVATAGHVDHGKSALVKALTGIDPDRLPEEKARGITIDLGFASLNLPAPPDRPPALFRIGIVDVPGHEDFVKNMVAGVGSIDLALLVVAADDGWMPQTEEHLQILSYLGARRGVIALTKIDLAPNDEGALAASIREELRGTPLADAPVVATSTLTGQGLEELKQVLARALSDTPPPRDIGKPRLPVDRVFTLRGIGTVVTGTLIGGSLSRGQPVVVQPTGRSTRIRSMQSYHAEVQTSVPGARTALNLPDLSIAARNAPSTGEENVRRGEVITLAELGGPSQCLDVLLIKSARLLGKKSRAARPLKDQSRIHFHHGSACCAGRVFLLGRSELGPGEEALAQVRLEAPLFAFSGDRFIIRDAAEQATLCGGVVLDADGHQRNFRSERQKQFLERIAGLASASGGQSLAWENLALRLEAQLERDGAVPRSGLLVKSVFSAVEIERALSQLAAAGKVFLSSHVAARGDWWATLRAKAAALIDAEHEAHPQNKGLPLPQLRAALQNDLVIPEVFDCLLIELCRNGFVQTGAAIGRQAHRPALPPQLQAAGAKLRATLAAKPLEPPSRKELAPDALSQQALRFLIGTGEATELGPDTVLLTEHFDRAVGAIRKILAERGPSTVSDLRQALGTSRRIMVPLLERLDRDGTTVRQGDKRVLKG